MPCFQAHERPPPSSLSVSESSFSDALRFQAHQPAPLSSSPPVCESLFVTCHVSKLTSPLLPLPPLQMVSPFFATCHVSELTNPFLPLPPLQEVSPLFAMCHISKLTNPSLPLPPLQEVSPHLQRATFPSSPTRLSHTFSPPASESLFCTMPCFRAHQPTPPSFSPPASESPFCNMPRFRAH